MDVDSESHGLWSAAQIEELEIPIASDGLLLYVGEAAYEPGESPLSVWVPRKYPEEAREASESSAQPQPTDFSAKLQGTEEGPLDCFERFAALFG